MDDIAQIAGKLTAAQRYALFSTRSADYRPLLKPGLAYWRHDSKWRLTLRLRPMAYKVRAYLQEQGHG